METAVILSTLTYPHIDPVIFRLGPLAVRWYGVAYILGFYLSYILLRRLIRSEMLKITTESLSDLLTWLVAGVMIGGRAGWWLFYHHHINTPEPWYEPLAVWHGGMSFHGGLIGVSVVLVGWSRRRHAPLWNLADAAALVVPVGLFFGRIANFINAELVGRPSTVPWAMIFPGDSVARHPSQLYEAVLEGPTLLLCLWGVRRILHLRDGQTAALFLILYGMFRFAVEFTREPDSQLGFIAFGWLTMGQLLSIVISLVGLVLWASHRQRTTEVGDISSSTNTI
jgi:phosphatidylglycerol:prolipoprotein diacylglycerol transferase